MSSGIEEKKTIKAVLWDLDGTLLDSDSWHSDSLNAALEERGYAPIAPAKFSTRLVFESAGVPESEHEDIIHRRWDFALRYAYERCVPNVHHQFCLAALKVDGYRNILVSNSLSPYVMVAIRKCGLWKYIDGVLAGDMGKHKPDPDLYQKAWRSIRLQPYECLAIEDSDSGIQAATAAGVPSWQVRGPEQITYENVLRRIQEEECFQSSSPWRAEVVGSPPLAIRTPNP